MPLYPCICEVQACGRTSEAYLSLADYEQGIRPECPDGHGPMVRYYTARSQRAQAFDAIVIDEAPDGTFSHPMHTDAPIPEGYIRRELRTFQEADAVLRKVNSVERRKIEQFVEQQHANLSEMEARNHSELRQLMSRMTPAQRAFAQVAMQVNESRRPKSFDPGVYLPVRELDASNRDAYEDKRTGWKNRKG